MSLREARRPLARPAVVAGTAVLALLDELAGLLAGVTVVLPHLLDVPIALANYLYPRRGTLIAAGIAAAYAAMTLTLAPSEGALDRGVCRHPDRGRRPVRAAFRGDDQNRMDSIRFFKYQARDEQSGYGC